MKQKWLTMVVVLISCIGMLAVFPAGSQEDIVFVQDSAFETLTRPPVPFPHDEHNANAGIEECNTCHHVYEDGKKVDWDSSEGMECSECHLETTRGKPMALIRAYHLQCRSCHVTKKAGPVMCGECHLKN